MPTGLLIAGLIASIVSPHVDWPILKSYEGEYLRRVKMPMGGIGTGTISLSGTGELVDWEIRGNSDKGFAPNIDRNNTASGFWVRTESDKVEMRMLAGPVDTMYYEGGEGAYVANHGFPRFRDCQFKVAYPLAQVELKDASMPITATLEAMNPLIPQDTSASSIPAVLYRWRITNISQKPQRVSVYGLLVNPAGGEVLKRRFESARLSGVEIGSAEDNTNNCTLGRCVLGVDKSMKVSIATSLADLGWKVRMDRVWKDFQLTGKARDCKDEFAKRDMPAVAVAVEFSLKPGETEVAPFVLAWRFPHRYGWTERGYRSEVVKGDFPAENDLGNYYATEHSSALSAAEKLMNNLTDYEQRTVAFVRGIMAIRAPEVVKEAALFNLSTLRCETCFRAADGHFFGWEGVFDCGGSCYGNCAHVWGYEHALIDLWPELAKDMTELQFGPQMDQATGHISFRVGLPLHRRARSTIAAADGQMQCIIKAYENWRKTKDDAWMQRLYPKVRKAMEFCWVKGGWDADVDGVMEGCQHNTMDVEYYGPNPQMEFLYLAALKAMKVMAERMKDEAFAEKCRDLVVRGSAWTEKNLFNGSFYRHIVVPPKGKIAQGIGYNNSKNLAKPDYQLAGGCLIDQLLGDYASRHVGLGAVADEEHSRIALQTIITKCSSANVGFRYNCGRDYAFAQETALKMAWYPEGTMPEKPFPYYGENMTGFEYVVAANLAQRGEFEAAEKIVRDIRSRYDGKKRNPFDEAECGHHYARALAAWTVLKAFE